MNDKQYSNKVFIFRVTNTCNYSCSFCINEESMQDKRINPDIINILDNYLKENQSQFEGFSISGGEPFSKSGLLEQAINIFLQYIPEGSNRGLTIHTNGTYLNEDIVNVFNSIPEIHINVSLDGIYNGERNIQYLVDNAIFGIGVLSSIKKLKNKSITVVIDNFKNKTRDLATELFILSNTFGCEILVRLNEKPEALKQLNLDDVIGLQKLIIRLMELDLWKTKVSLAKFFRNECSCDNVTLLPSGQIINPNRNHDKENVKGCKPLYYEMLPGMYELISKIILDSDNIYIETDLDTSPPFFEKVKKDSRGNSMIAIKEVN